MYQRSAFSPVSATSSNPLFRDNVFTSTSHEHSRHIPNLGDSSSDSASLVMDSRPPPAVMIRKLPRTTSDDTLQTMLMFANDLIDTEFVRSPYPDDQGFATAIARFRSQAGAIDAQQKLNGKPNTTKEANIVVELHSSGMAGTFERRPTIDATSRNQTSSASSAASSSIGAPTTRSRFGSTFQSSDKISPPLVTSSSAGSSNEFPNPENSHFQALFSPTSPLANGFDDRHRISGKSIINDNGADDETGELLKDPLAYAKNGQGRRPTVPQLPINRFNNLSLSTPNGIGNGLTSPPPTGVAPRGMSGMQSPMSANSMMSPGLNGSFSLNYPRPQYPPVNPADQNPPCNTLYVGNLPIDASEDELKAIFSKQRGYKRLCFRTKQNGPMCFVEFEDVSFATKALNELYGHPLHNSVKGGIRLSFSKNPLGVRSGQSNGVAQSSPITSPVMSPGGYSASMMSNGSFSAVSGPPPGLGAPPGLVNGNGDGNGSRSQSAAIGMDSMFANPFGMPAHSFGEATSPRNNNLSGGLPPNMSGQFGRDGRPGFNDYMLGR